MGCRFPAHLWLAALMILVCSTVNAADLWLDPDPDWRNTASLGELTEGFDDWLDENSDFPRPATRPIIKFVEHGSVAALRGLSGASHGRTRGLFDPDTMTIYLVAPWDPGDPQDASVLLHELVHARQVNRHYYCPGAQEDAAYRLQDRWLGERGLRAKVNWIAVVLEAGCSRRDIHPD